MISKLHFLILLSLIFVFFSCGEKVEEEIKVKSVREEPSNVSNNKSETDTTKNPAEDEGLPPESSGEKENPSGFINPSSAGKYMGERMTVKGYVADVHITKKVAYLNFDEKYPKNTFTGVIFSRSFPEFTDIKKYESKTVEITGTISEYKGKAQIILESEDQIKISE